MRLFYGQRYILVHFLLCIGVNEYSALAPIHLPIFDLIYQKSNRFNESIHETNKFDIPFDFVIIGSGSGKFLFFGFHIILCIAFTRDDLSCTFCNQVVPSLRID